MLKKVKKIKLSLKTFKIFSINMLTQLLNSSRKVACFLFQLYIFLLLSVSVKALRVFWMVLKILNSLNLNLTILLYGHLVLNSWKNLVLTIKRISQIFGNQASKVLLNIQVLEPSLITVLLKKMIILELANGMFHKLNLILPHK